MLGCGISYVERDRLAVFAKVVDLLLSQENFNLPSDRNLDCLRRSSSVANAYRSERSRIEVFRDVNGMSFDTCTGNTKQDLCCLKRRLALPYMMDVK